MWKTVLFLLFSLVAIPLLTYYTDTSPTQLQSSIIDSILLVYVIAATLCFVVSSITKNYSQVDKLWSIIPIVYVWIATVKAGFEPRLILMASLTTIWGIRLTYNFNRRGGYTLKFWEGEEDYRWAILRAKPEFSAKWKWTAFNLLFISFYQMGLIMLFTFPIIKAVQGTPLGIWDLLLTTLFLGFVLYEYIADEQQWRYQTEKYRRIEAKEELTGVYKKGFIDTGLWSKSRHPNYFAEQSIWIIFYLFSVVATGSYFNWSIAGCILLILLFQGSANFSEGVSASKYPDYQDYQKKTGKFLPKLR